MIINQNKHKDLYIGVFLLLVGFFARWIYVLNLDISDPLRGDATSYYYYAKNLLEFGVFSKDHGVVAPVPDSYWAPGYPFFLAICFKLADLFNVSFYPVTLFAQACIGAFTAQLTYHLGRFFLPSKSALWAALLVVLSPHLNSFGGYILTETLFSLLFLFAIYISLKAINSPLSKWRWMFAGLCWGLAYLTNPVVLVIPFAIIFIFFVSCWKASNAKLFIVPTLSLFLIFLLFVGGWQIREWIFVPEGKESTSGRAFENLVIGSHSDFHDVWRANIVERQNKEKLVNLADVDISQYQHDHAAFYRVLAERFSAEPAHYLYWYCVQKPSQLWGWNVLAGEGDIYQYPVNSSLYHKSKLALMTLVLMKQLHPLLIFFAILGLVAVFRENDIYKQKNILVVAMCLISVSAVYVILHTDGRYSIPMRPELYLMSIYGIGKCYEWVKSAQSRKII